MKPHRPPHKKQTNKHLFVSVQVGEPPGWLPEFQGLCLTMRPGWLSDPGGAWMGRRRGSGDLGHLWGAGVLAPCWCCFDLSLMSSQHMAAPSAPQGPARLPVAQPADSATAAHSEKSQFPHCTVRFTRGNHISLGEPQAAPPCPAWPAATGTDGGAPPSPPSAPLPPAGDPSRAPNLQEASPQLGPGIAAQQE